MAWHEDGTAWRAVTVAGWLDRGAPAYDQCKS